MNNKIYKMIHKNKNLQLGLIAIGLVVVFLVVLNLNFKSNKVVEFKIPKKYDQPLIVKSFGYVLSLQPVNAQGSKRIQIDKDTIKYEDVYLNTNIVQTKQTNKLKEDIILKAFGHPEKFEYKLNLQDYDYEIDLSGNLNFYIKGFLKQVDKKLYKVFTIPKPYMFEEKNPEKHGKVQMKIEKNKLILIPDMMWIIEHKYPIIIDPTVEASPLNIFSKPRIDENWEITFVTQIKGNLKIILTSEDAIKNEDFVSLSCDEEIKEPKINKKEGFVYYTDWECSGIGKVIYETKKEGEHELRFEFEPQLSSEELIVDYADNGKAGDNCYEALIRVEKTGLKEAKDGDVIVIKQCGHNWGIGELDETKFKIIMVPFLTEQQINEFTESEYIDGETGDISKFRKYGIDYETYFEKEYAITNIIKLKTEDEESIIKSK